MNCRQNFSRKNSARFNSLVTSVDSSVDLLFKIQTNFANPRELHVNWTVLRSFFRFTVEKRNFLRHGDLKNAFWVSIRGGVSDATFEAKAEDSKKFQGQGLTFRGQTLSRPRTGQEWSRPRPRTKNAIFLNCARRIFHDF